MEYIKKVACKCYNCHAISMEKIIVDSERIKLDLEERLNEINENVAKNSQNKQT